MERLSFSMALLVMVALVLVGSTNAQLKMGFYSKSCPKAEKIIQDFVHQKISTVPSLAATFIRMHFHDCFVRGCDASVLLNTTSGEQPEKQSPPNLTLRGFDFIDRVKSLVEAECPGVVSCADVLTLVTRDSIVAVVCHILRNLVGLDLKTNFTTLQTLFANQGLDVKDLVLLSVSNRLYNFTGRGDADPALDSDYASNLRSRKCRTINDNTTKVEMDPGSRNTFDLSYYSLLLKRRGLFESDAALTTNSASLQLVDKIAKGSVKDFFSEFALAMEKMGRINVKTGSNGEIRKQCALVN
ncbi:Peroxidase 39 [Linum perenne]